MRITSIAAATVAATLLTGCGGGEQSQPASQAPEPETFTASGILELTNYTNVDFDYATMNDCFGVGGYDDLVEGAQVTVYDADGTKVALGQLGQGELDGESGTCSFRFTVRNIPAEGNIYGVEVTNRGQVDFARADADALQLTIG